MKSENMNPNLLNAILQKVAFKGDEMRRYQAACIYTALALYPQEFGADDVPEPLRPQSMTTAGCAFALLKSDGLQIFARAGRRKSKSKDRNGAWINTYTLPSPRLACAWLTANGFPVEFQGEVKQQQLL